MSTLSASATTRHDRPGRDLQRHASSPAHNHQRVLLQEQNSTSGNGWQTIASGYTTGASAFSITHRFRSAGSYTLRAFFPGDPRNIASQSADASRLTVQQQQNPSFTINGSAPAIINGQSVSITGTLYAAGSTTTVQPDVSVTLYGRQATGAVPGAREHDDRQLR